MNVIEATITMDGKEYKDNKELIDSVLPVIPVGEVGKLHLSYAFHIEPFNLNVGKVIDILDKVDFKTMKVNVINFTAIEEAIVELNLALRLAEKIRSLSDFYDDEEETVTKSWWQRFKEWLKC